MVCIFASTVYESKCFNFICNHHYTYIANPGNPYIKVRTETFCISDDESLSFFLLKVPSSI